MKLNLQIIKEDLSDLTLKSHFTDDRLLRRLSFPTLFHGSIKPAGNKLYLTYATDLPDSMDFDDTPSFLSIGMPSEYYLKSNCNILYTEKDIDIIDLLDRILDIFEKYYLWEKSLQDINNKNLPLRALGEVAEIIFGNPVSLIEPNFRVIFSIVNPEHYYITPKHMLEPQDFIYLDIDEINVLKLDSEYKSAVNSIEPTIFSEKLYSYRSLYYNIRIDDIFVVRFIIYEIGRNFTDRDFSLCKYFCEHLTNGILRKDINNFNQPRGFDEIINKLIRHIMIDEDRIVSVLRENEWEVDDDYFCLNIEPFSKDDEDHQLISTFAMQLSVHSSNNSYSIKDNKLIFIFNLTKSGKSRHTVLSSMVPQLRDWLFRAGISTVFSDFKNLYYYYKQAEYALSVGKTIDSSFWYYRFEDYLLPHIINKSKEKLIPEALYPEGLLKLIKYDKMKETNYCEILKIYLENNMNIAKTIRQTFLHRNTFLYRIDKINEILNMDLNNPDVRLSLLIAFKIMHYTYMAPKKN